MCFSSYFIFSYICTLNETNRETTAPNTVTRPFFQASVYTWTTRRVPLLWRVVTGDGDCVLVFLLLFYVLLCTYILLCTINGTNRETTAPKNKQQITRPCFPSRQVYVDQLAEQLSYRQVLRKACESIKLATSDANAKVTSKVRTYVCTFVPYTNFYFLCSSKREAAVPPAG